MYQLKNIGEGYMTLQHAFDIYVRKFFQYKEVANYSNNNNTIAISFYLTFTIYQALFQAL